MSSNNNENNNKQDTQKLDDDVYILDDTTSEDLDLKSSDPEANEESKSDEVANLKLELEKQKKEFLYLRAEFDNFRKQSIKERSDLIRFGAERISRDLLNVTDLMEKAMLIEVTAETINSYVEGINLTAKELTKTLEKHGIKEMEAKGKAFDPVNSEALSQIPTAEIPEGHVVEVMRKGYNYHEKVLRPAQVVIASKPVDSE